MLCLQTNAAATAGGLADFSELGGGVDFSGFGVGATDGVGNEDEGPGGVGGDEDDEMPDLMPASASDGPEPEPEPE